MMAVTRIRQWRSSVQADRLSYSSEVHVPCGSPVGRLTADVRLPANHPSQSQNIVTDREPSTRTRYLWAVLLGLAALGVNQVLVRLLAADSPAFFFGGTFVLIAFLQLGARAGILAGLISCISFFARGDIVGYVTVIYVLEAYVACQLNKRYQSLILSVMLFWFGGGWLLDIVVYHYIVGLQGEYVVLVFVKQVFNGIIIAMLAELLLRLPIVNNLLTSGKDTAVTELRSYIFNRTIFVAMLAVLVLGLWFTRATYQNRIGQTQLRGQSVATNAGVAVESFLSMQSASLAEIGRQAARQSALESPLAAIRFIQMERPDRGEWTWMGISDREGNLIGSTGAEASATLIDLAGTAVFREARARDPLVPALPVFEELRLDSTGASAASLWLAEPLENQRGGFSGALVAAMDASAISSILTRVRGQNLETVTVFNQDLQAIASVGSDWTPGYLLSNSVPADSLLGVSARTFSYLPPADGTLESTLLLNLKHSVYHPVGTTGWGILVELPTQRLHSEMMPTSYRVLGFLVITLIVLHLVVTNMSGKVSDPLLIIDHTAREIAAGRNVDLAAIQGLQKSPITEVRSMATNVQVMEQALAEKEAFSKERERESEERFRATFDQAAVGIAHSDTESTFLRVNDRFCDVVGYSRDELQELTAFAITHPEDVEKEKRLVDEILDGSRQAFSIEKRLLRPDDKVVWVQATVSLVRESSGPPKYFIHVVEDISARKSLEEQLLQAQKMESVGQLAGGVAHDFNNLLTPIIGYAELAMGDLPDDSPLHANQKKIIESAQRARTLTQQLLAFGRRQVLHTEVLNLSDEVSQFTGIMRRVIRENIDVRLNLDARLGSIRADPSQINQILMNLLVNAQDAMPDGGTIFIETANVYRSATQPEAGTEVLSGKCVALSVRDSGHGMDQHIAAHVFEPFFTTKEREKGTGLGLATVYGIVKQHGGDIELDTEVTAAPRSDFYSPACPTSQRRRLRTNRNRIDTAAQRRCWSPRTMRR